MGITSIKGSLPYRDYENELEKIWEVTSLERRVLAGPQAQERQK